METSRLSCSVRGERDRISAEPEEVRPSQSWTSISLASVLDDINRQHEQLMEQVVLQQKEICSLMEECENEVKGSKSSASEETQDAKALWSQETLALELHWLPTAFLFSLKLVGDFNPVLVKLKKFSYPSFRVICKLFDKSGEPAVFHASLDFVINVYHARPPLRKLTGRKSASNKSLLSGVKRIQVADNSTVAFEDLRFIGITAKLKPKWAVLIVQCLNVPEIRPCFIPGVYVKSPSKYVPKYAASLFGSNVKTEDLCLG